MKDRVQGCVTAGVALVGAGVMAAAPVAQQAPEVLRSATADVELAAAPAPYTQSVPELLALSAQRSVTGLASAPVGLATAAIALAQGGPAQNAAAYAILKEIVDGPQWAADPAIYAFDDVLPEPIGGDTANNPTNPDADSAISQFRADVLIAARDDVKEAIGDSLGRWHADQTSTTKGPSTPLPGSARGLAVSAAARSHKRCHRAARARGRRARPADESRWRQQHGRCTGHFRPTSTRRITSPIRLSSPWTMCCRSPSAAIRRQIRH